MEKKRDIFPRFYFLSDPGLLEILGQASDPTSIQQHLSGLFDNLNSVLFHGTAILDCYSREMDKLVLLKPVLAVGNVELWLLELMEHAQQVMVDGSAFQGRARGFFCLGILTLFNPGPSQLIENVVIQLRYS